MGNADMLVVKSFNRSDRFRTGQVACLLVNALALIAALAAGPAWACSCGYRSPSQWLEGSPLIFLGTVESVEVPKSSARPSAPGKAVFRIHRLYKGTVDSDTIEIQFATRASNTCGTSFKVGETGPVFASVWGPGFGMGVCSRALSLGSAIRLLPPLDAYRIAVKQATISAQADASPSKWNELALLQESQKDFLGVSSTLRRLSSLAPQDSQYPRREGDAMFALGKSEQALEAFGRALAIDSTDAAANRGRDQALINLKRATEVDERRRDFSAMTIDGADFARRDLTGASFASAKINSTKFADTNLAGTDFSGAKIYTVDFSNANMSAARLRGLTSYGANFSGSDLRRSDFSKAEVRDGTLDGADLRDADLSNAAFLTVTMRRARLQGANLKGIIFRNVDLTEADLSHADLSGVNLAATKLDGAKFIGARYSPSTRWPSGFNPETAGPVLDASN